MKANTKRGPKPRIAVDPSKVKIDVLVEKIRVRLYESWERNVERALEQLDALLVTDEKPRRVPGPHRDARPQNMLRKAEAATIERSLDEHDGNVTQAAKSLGIHRQSLQRKIRANSLADVANGKRKCGRCRQAGHRADRCPNELVASDDEEPPRAAAPKRRSSLQETYEMITRAQAGDRTAMTDLVRQNIGLVHWVARKHAWSSVPYEDMIQEGQIGLVEAIKRFDVSRGLKLSTFAPNWIRHFIGRAHDNDGLIRLPVASHHQLRLIARAQQSVDSGASYDDVAEHAGIRAKSVQRLLERGTVTMPATLPDVAAPADDGDEERVTLAREHIASLPERLRRVMELRYSGDGMTLLEVGNVLGVSRERVRQLETTALKTLRAKCAADEGAPP